MTSKLRARTSSRMLLNSGALCSCTLQASHVKLEARSTFKPSSKHAVSMPVFAHTKQTVQAQFSTHAGLRRRRCSVYTAVKPTGSPGGCVMEMEGCSGCAGVVGAGTHSSIFPPLSMVLALGSPVLPRLFPSGSAEETRSVPAQPLSEPCPLPLQVPAALVWQELAPMCPNHWFCVTRRPSLEMVCVKPCMLAVAQQF